jgi:uncharacterized protein (TIGR03435 family)
MQCDKFRDHFSDYLIERLTPRDQAALSRHLRDCASCKAELEEWTDIWVKMGSLAPAGIGEPASPEMSARLRRSVKEYKAEWSLQEQQDRRNGKLWQYALMAAAAILVVVASVTFLQRRSLPVAPGTIVEGSLNRTWGGQTDLLRVGDTVERGEGLRTEETGAVLALADGSRVEMRQQSELSLEHADDGVRIRLSEGGVIVNAARQRSGHLYVQTKEITVSVVGTVFLVNAEAQGSHVAVIEGEVRVQQGAEYKKLLRGEQLSTNPQMEPLPVTEEISWSREAETHVALLQQAVAPPPVTPKRFEFEVASIKPRPEGVRGGNGFACQGSDGIVALEGALQTPAGVPRGRCVGQTNLAQLVSIAYGVPRRNVSGGPEWMQQPLQGFVIEAKALDPGSATAEQLRQMLQTLLSDRFKLKIHRSSQELQQYVLRVAKNGLKLKASSNPTEVPHLVPSGLGITIKGTSDLRRLADFLVAMVGFPVLDGTSDSGIYDYTLRLNMVEGQRGGGNGVRGAGGAGAGNISVTEFDPPVSTALQEQLGLQIDMEKVPTEVIVIDQAERPEEN